MRVAGLRNTHGSSNLSARAEINSYYRLRTPDRIASLLRHLLTETWVDIETAASTEGVTRGILYHHWLVVLEKFFPMQHLTVTIRSKEPEFVTPFIKVVLRRRSKLLRRGCHEAAAASVSARINSCIVKRNAVSFDGLGRGSRELWAEVNRLRRPRQEVARSCGRSDLNRHYVGLSTDHKTCALRGKQLLRIPRLKNFQRWKFYMNSILWAAPGVTIHC